LIICNRPDLLCPWVELGIYGFTRGYDGTSKAIGYILDDKLIAAVTYSNFSAREDGTFFNLEMGVYSIDKRWCNRQYLRTVFAYPFIGLGSKRVQTVCSAEDEGVIMFNQRLGFTQEGRHRNAWHDGQDSISWSMLKGECQWL
jgi:RimJ/RimL family protein N-acetyltransferase